MIAFLKRTMTPDGAWPQIVYARTGGHALASLGSGGRDILLAFLAAEEPLPEPALQRLLDGQLASGGFVSGAGFAAQRSQHPSAGPPDFRDLLPVSGWNDKTFRLLCELLPAGTPLPEIEPEPVEREVSIGGHHGRFVETGEAFRLEAAAPCTTNGSNSCRGLRWLRRRWTSAKEAPAPGHFPLPTIATPYTKMSARSERLIKRSARSISAWLVASLKASTSTRQPRCWASSSSGTKSPSPEARASTSR